MPVSYLIDPKNAQNIPKILINSKFATNIIIQLFVYNISHMHFIIGLGNPGEKYAGTRHNVGFFMLLHFIGMHGLPEPHASSKYGGKLSEGMVGSEEVKCLFPDTYMNHSGTAAAKLVPKGHVEQLIVLYDDVDLPLGEFKVSFGRGDGGHNGIRSLIASLGSKDFVRVRIGVAQRTVWPWERGEIRRPKGERMGNFVLASFTKKERQELEALAPNVVAAVTDAIIEGREAAMNRFN